MAYKKEGGSEKKPLGRPPGKKSVKKDSPFQQFYKPEKSGEKEPESKVRSRSKFISEDKPNVKKSTGTSSNPFSKSKTFTQKFDTGGDENGRAKTSRTQGDKTDVRPNRFAQDRPDSARRDTNRFSVDRPTRPDREDRFSSDRPDRERRDNNERYSSDRRAGGREDRYSKDRPARSEREENRYSDDRPVRARRDDQEINKEDAPKPSRSKKLFEDDFFLKDNDRSGKSSTKFSRGGESRDGESFKRTFGQKDDFSKKPFEKKSDDRKFGDRPFYVRPERERRDNVRFSDDRTSRVDREDRFSKDRPDRRFAENKYDDKKPRSDAYDDRKYSKPYSEKKSSKSKSGDTEDTITRLNKYVAQSGLCSRRKAVELIKGGEVWVNGKQELNPAYEMQATDEVTHKSVVLKKEEKMLYLLMNKPKNIITTSEDEKGRKTVLDLVAGRYDERVYPVGRLDRNTTGLLLLTNDGELAKKLAHPSHMVKKFYQVELDKNLKSSDIDKIKDGLNLEDGVAEVDAIDYIEGGKKNEVGVEIHIGKNRIVRRIFESLGYEVIKLDRTYYGGLTKKDLPRGFIRELTPQEVIMLKHFTNNRKKE